ncbi:MAG: DUF4352 domain-containing protein [Dehalococcoidia bacterium]|nr:DUF4352 domain-containing protein [Dehalococcoidia bacterium]
MRVGDVRWKVIKAESPKSLRALFGSDKNPTGKYVLLAVEVENLGKKMVSTSGVKIVDSQGREFTHSSETFNLDPKHLFFQNLNPNVPFRFSEVFDIAPDATGLKAKVSNLELFSTKDVLVDLGI